MSPELVPCTRKGCAWRGPKGQRCPMHEDEAWDRQWQLLPHDGEGKRRKLS